MSEPVLLGEILPDVIGDIKAQRSIFVAFLAEKAMLDACSSIENPASRIHYRDSRNDCRRDDSSTAYAGTPPCGNQGDNLAQGKAKHRQKCNRPA